MSQIDESDLQFPDAGSGDGHDDPQTELTSFDSSTLMFPSVGGDDEPQHTQPAQPPQPPATQRRKPKSAASSKPAAQSQPAAQPASGDGFDLPVWGAGATAHDDDEPTQLFTPADAAQTKTTAMPAIDSTGVERTQLIAQNGPTRTVVNDVNETHTAVPEPDAPASFVPMDGGDSGDGEPPEHAAPNGGDGKRKKIIIGSVVAVVALALVAGGAALWQRNRSAQEANAQNAAFEPQTEESAVADAATLQAFQKSNKTATDLQQKQGETLVECKTSDSREQLDRNAQTMDEKLDGVESATKQLKADADALTVSRDAKSTKSLKDDLAKAIADAQATYDASANAVADEQTRTALQQAIGEAQTVADKPSLDKAAVDAAKEKLTNAVNAVVESQNALAEANAAVAQEALRQQQLQQQQAQQTQPGTTGADASTGLGTTTGGVTGGTTNNGVAPDTGNTGGNAAGDTAGANTGANANTNTGTPTDTGVTQ
ncbi:FIVAR domain-containing protein [uncultured Bifidobacterium sp.]|uniref:FIVAR domain-containing protein n=1 Tax=uncultured Bifidobacterium sp. TaxID=165187 RepID=UPI0025882136|nr:FIVAR domain-containing protein [uncultured Bifidobacterium sp.]